jgi:MoxR-like ATPase
VDHDKLPVATPPYVELESLCAKLQCLPEGTHGVFRFPWISWRAAVSEDNHDSSLRFGRAWDKLDCMNAQLETFKGEFQRVHQEISKVIVGYSDIIDDILMAILGKGHVLLEGVPGLGKTKLVQTLSDALHLRSSRIQFTPDLMPADIVGTNVVQENEAGDKFLDFQPGPIFANIILADEINRATPKTQSALLEAMQEKTVTVGKQTYKLEQPFVVLATLNPLELEATYPLPEAQLDRFFLKLKMDFPGVDDIHTILDRTTYLEEPSVERVWDAQKILELREVALGVPISDTVQDYAIRIVMATQPSTALAHEQTKKFLRYGASPRGAQALTIGGKVRALLNGRSEVDFADIRHVVLPALRHRIILNFEGEAERIDPDTILKAIIDWVPEKR